MTDSISCPNCGAIEFTAYLLCPVEVTIHDDPSVGIPHMPDGTLDITGSLSYDHIDLTCVQCGHETNMAKLRK